jgi:hypothetical protein
MVSGRGQRLSAIEKDKDVGSKATRRGRSAKKGRVILKKGKVTISWSQPAFGRTVDKVTLTLTAAPALQQDAGRRRCSGRMLAAGRAAQLQPWVTHTLLWCWCWCWCAAAASTRTSTVMELVLAVVVQVLVPVLVPVLFCSS